VLEAWGVELPESRGGRAGRRPVRSRALFGGLLRCHCGRTMTPNVVRGQYYCSAGRDSGAELHGRYSVTEKALRASLEPEAARHDPGVGTRFENGSSAERDLLEARKERALQAFLAGAMLEARWRTETA